LVAISLGVFKCETRKGEGVGFGAAVKPFDRKYLENGGSVYYNLILF